MQNNARLITDIITIFDTCKEGIFLMVIGKRSNEAASCYPIARDKGSIPVKVFFAYTPANA